MSLKKTKQGGWLFNVCLEGFRNYGKNKKGILKWETGNTNIEHDKMEKVVGEKKIKIRNRMKKKRTGERERETKIKKWNENGMK